MEHLRGPVDELTSLPGEAMDLSISCGVIGLIAVSLRLAYSELVMEEGFLIEFALDLDLEVPRL